MTEHSPDTKGNAIRKMTAGMTAAAVAIGQELGKDGVTTGLHSSSILKQPVTDGFGTFSRRWKYVEGCMPIVELDKDDVGEVRCEITAPDGQARIVTIGKTPTEWNPALGGVLIRDAGDGGEYLMAVASVTDIESGVGDSSTKFRYLDSQDLQDARLEHGAGFTLGANPDRSRQVTIEGTIAQTSALLA